MYGKTYSGQAPFQALRMKELAEASLTALWYRNYCPRQTDEETEAQTD